MKDDIAETFSNPLAFVSLVEAGLELWEMARDAAVEVALILFAAAVTGIWIPTVIAWDVINGRRV